MTKAEVARLLTLIAAFDRRTIGEADVEAWHLILVDLAADDCAQAVREHFTTSTEWLMPAHIRKLAIEAEKRRRSQRRQAEIAEQIRRETGEDAPLAITSGGPAPEVAQAMRLAVLNAKRANRQREAEAEQQRRERREQTEAARREIAERQTEAAQ